MTALNPNETARTWKANRREPSVQLYLSAVEGDAASLVANRVAGFPLGLNIMAGSDWVRPAGLAGAGAAGLPVEAHNAASLNSLPKLAPAVA